MIHTFEPLLVATHQQLFRLALFVTGSPDAATRLLVQATKSVEPSDSAPEAAILRGLQPKQRRYGRWEPGEAERVRAGLDMQQARALLRLVGQLSPVERLAIGLHYVRGLETDEIGALARNVPDAAEVLHRFRVQVAKTLGVVQADADTATLSRIDMWLEGRLNETDASELRGLTFADAETRTMRDGMLHVRTQLPHMLGGMFSVQAPATLLDELLVTDAPKQARPRIPARRTAIVALILGVVALAATIIVVPSLRLQPNNTTAAISASAILESALHRFERAPLQQGVLHERYSVTLADQKPLTIERYYDYAAPHRLQAEVRGAGDSQPRFSIHSDGRGTIHYRLPQAPDYTYQLTAEEAERATPLLRSVLMPIGFDGNRRYQPEISVLYLAQAQAQNATLAGRTNVGGRDAFLLRYTTDILPTEENAGERRQVLLSIDAKIWALLNVTVVADTGGESVAVTPWRAEEIAVLNAVPDSQFAFVQHDGVTINEPRSLSIPTIPQQMYSSLDTAVRESRQPLLAPTNLPETMRGFVLQQRRDNDSQRYMLLYEGEFHSVLLFPGNDRSNNSVTWSEESEVGPYRYRTSSGFGNRPGAVFAQIRRGDQPDVQATVLLMDPLSTPQAREQRLRELIASLQPVTNQNLEQFPQLGAQASS